MRKLLALLGRRRWSCSCTSGAGAARRRERVHLYYDDGSMVTLEPGAPQAERLLALARAAL